MVQAEFQHLHTVLQHSLIQGMLHYHGYGYILAFHFPDVFGQAFQHLLNQLQCCLVCLTVLHKDIEGAQIGEPGCPVLVVLLTLLNALLKGSLQIALDASHHLSCIYIIRSQTCQQITHFACQIGIACQSWEPWHAAIFLLHGIYLIYI